MNKYSRLLNELISDLKDEKLFIMQKDLKQIKEIIEIIEKKGVKNEKL